MSRVLGAILAGGMSRRFGSDKAAASYAGRMLIEHVAAALEPQVSMLVVCGGPARLTGTIILADRPAPGLGPLGGLSAALAFARAEGFDAVVSVGCDMPVLPPDLVARLAGAGPCAFIAEVQLIGLWPTSLGEALDELLATGHDRSMRHWARVAGAVEVGLGSVLPNINAPADLEALVGG